MPHSVHFHRLLTGAPSGFFTATEGSERSVIGRDGMAICGGAIFTFDFKGVRQRGWTVYFRLQGGRDFDDQSPG